MKTPRLQLPRRSLLGILPALVSAVLAGCSAIDILNATVASNTYRSSAGISYGQRLRQQLDVYQPASPTSNAPIVVFFYGGSWSSGNRADYRFVGEALAAQGIVTVVADYRLSPEVRYPAFVQDCALALRWAFDHAAELGASSQRLFVMGHSAGAYNAAMLALDPRWLRQVSLQPAQLAGWIGLAGPYDFLPINDPQTQVAFEWPQTQPDSQPITYAPYASSASPPALLLAPAADSIVNAQRSTVGMAQRLQQSGVPAEYALFDNVSHITIVATMAAVLRSRAPVLQRVTEFVNKHRRRL